ncbi:MAG: hypothetical protein ACW986_17590 [Promethearchaeota archaeon]|jgi:hypothetical protein
MPEKAHDSKRKYRIIIYHGHLHKIPIDDMVGRSQEEDLASTEEGIE